MEILSACYRQREKRDASILLQQYRYQGLQVLFACVCMGEGEDADKDGGYMAERLLQWFRLLNPDKLTRNPAKAIDRLSGNLARVIRKIDKELADGELRTENEKCGFAGILCLGNNYLMIHRGAQRIYLINTAFNRVYIRRLYGNEVGAGSMEQGSLQPNIGLLIATEPFYEHVSETMIKEGLCVGEVTTEGQMDRHLGELAREGARKGSVGIGAVYLRTL